MCREIDGFGCVETTIEPCMIASGERHNELARMLNKLSMDTSVIKGKSRIVLCIRNNMNSNNLIRIWYIGRVEATYLRSIYSRGAN